MIILIVFGIVFAIAVIYSIWYDNYAEKIRKMKASRFLLENELRKCFDENVKLKPKSKKIKGLEKFCKRFKKLIEQNKFSNKVIPFKESTENEKFSSRQSLCHQIYTTLIQIKFSAKTLDQFDEYIRCLERAMVRKDFQNLSDRWFALAFLEVIESAIKDKKDTQSIDI